MKAPDLQVPEHNGLTDFLWIKWSQTTETGTSHTGHANASDLGYRAGIVPGNRVWSDSCDVGFLVKGRKETHLFTLVEALTCSDDRGLCGWRYADGQGYEIVIHND